ncbi:MAG TPA: alkaline phosphatase PhoX [Nakamurella sp.]
MARIPGAGPTAAAPGAPRPPATMISAPAPADGPSAGAPMLRTKNDPSGITVLGTFANCSGGTTPWGTVLSGEENFQGYFRTSGAFPPDKRYGLQDKATTYGWEEVDARFDARGAGHETEPNRFGWIVELDPFRPDEPPVKHTALGRFKHEGANVMVGRSGHVAAYMGDDERFDYVYRFVSRNRMRSGTGSGARAHNKTLLSQGSLYVARFTGNSPADQIDGSGSLPADGAFDGTGEWLPIVVDGFSHVPGFSAEQALVCGDPADPGTYFAGFPRDRVAPISCPDNIAFDSRGDLWIATDGAPSTLGHCDGLFHMPLSGRDRGHLRQFLAVPREAETCGPVIRDAEGTVLVAVQHPGEDGTFADQHSFFPDYVADGAAPAPGQWRGPRPSVVQVWRDRD